MSCSCCEVTDRWFDRWMAEGDLRRYQRKGPNATTRILLAAIRQHAPGAATLLDIGSGVGVIAHELLKDGARRATVVDMSQAYLAAARARRNGDGPRSARDSCTATSWR